MSQFISKGFLQMQFKRSVIQVSCDLHTKIPGRRKRNNLLVRSCKNKNTYKAYVNIIEFH